MKFGNVVRVKTYDVDEDHTLQKQSSCSQAYGFAWLQEPSRFRSIIIFIKYREVSTHTIFLNFIDLSAETVLSSRFGGHKGGVAKGEKGEKRKRTSSI